jgi:hypothetical protein
MPSRRSLLLAAAIGVFALLGAGADGCSTETKTTADGGTGGGAARLGDPITLEGADTKMVVTASNIADPADVGPYDESLEEGSRFVAVDFQLKNVGETTYDDSPSNGAVLITRDGRQAQSSLVSGGACGDGFYASATISAGANRRGCIVFEVPGDAKVGTVQFTLDSGFGPQAGEWKVGK